MSENDRAVESSGGLENEMVSLPLLNKEGEGIYSRKAEIRGVTFGADARIMMPWKLLLTACDIGWLWQA